MNRVGRALFCSLAFILSTDASGDEQPHSSMAIQDHLIPSKDCGRLLMRSDANWPPLDWAPYLAQRSQSPLQVKDAATAEFPVELLANGPAEDSRFYLLHKRLESRREYDSNYQSEVAAAKSPFRFLYKQRTSHGQTFYVFQPLGSGQSICTTMIFDRNSYASPIDFGRALNTHLTHIKALVDQNVQNPDLDFYFHLVDRGLPFDNDFGPRIQPHDASSKTHFQHKAPVELLSNGFVRFAVRTNEHKGQIVVSTIDTIIEQPDVTVTVEQVAQGQKQHLAWLDEIALVLYPRYVRERNWNQDYIDDDYKKLQSTRNLTRYVTVQARDPVTNEPGKYLAILGMNRAPYGTVTYHDKASQRWVKQVGGFGQPYLEDYLRVDTPTFEAALWRNPAPLSGMEDYMNIRLDRLSVIDGVTLPNGLNSILGQVDDGRYPVYYGIGVIYEPVKFFIVDQGELQGSLRGLAYAELVATILKSVFPNNRDMRYNLNAQYFATYNPKREGIILYRKQGFEVLESYPTKQVGKTAFHAFGASAPSFLARFNPNTRAEDGSDSEALNVIESIRKAAASIKVRQSERKH